MSRLRRAAGAAGLAAASAVGLVGCATTALPPARQLSSTAPAAWQAALPPVGDASTTADLQAWWGRFSDPLLPELIAAAQAASPSLASAAARIERARAARAAAASAAGPQAGLGASATLGRSVPGAPTAFSASVGAQMAWEIDLFGGLAAARDAAQARLEGAQAGWHDARAAVAAETATSYLALRACEAQREQTALDAASRAETARLTGLAARAGFAAPADAALADAGAAQSRSQLGALRAQCDTLLKSLVEMTDLPEPVLRQRLAPATAALPRPPAIAPAELPAAALAQRPDIHAAARAVIAAAGDRADAQARERPQLSLSGNLAQTTLRSGGDTVSGLTWSFGPLQVVFPVLDGGARAAASAAAQAGYDEAVALYRAQVRRAVREVESALVAVQATAERGADAQRAAAGFEASLRATAARQRGGLASLFELEESRRNAVAAQIALIELQRDGAAAWIALYRALGGGWHEGAALAATPGVAAAGMSAATDSAHR